MATFQGVPAAVPAGPVHFVGIGGAGQRATAELLLGQDVVVTGSDVQDSPGLASLRSAGAHVRLGHAAANVGNARLVVVSSAVPEENPEIVEARRRQIEVIKNAELLRRIGQGRRTLAVAGTHGKTTTTGMLAWTLTSAGADPTAIVGGEVRNLGVSGRAGKGPWFVVEADEYDRRFLSLDPWCAVVLNLELDHLDYYGSETALREAFQQFVARPATDGGVVLCADDAGAVALAACARAPVVTYGTGPANWQATDVQLGPDTSHFTVTRDGQRVADCTLRLPGIHNVRNALACCAAAALAGIAPATASAALGEYLGARRRFELVGEAHGIPVLIDYGHLPTELRMTLAGARQRYPGRRLWALFQPHTYARTRLLMDDFVAALSGLEQLAIVGAYVPSGREQVHSDLESRELAQRLGVPYLEGRTAVPAALRGRVQTGDVVLLLGAGDIYLAAEPVLQELGCAP